MTIFICDSCKNTNQVDILYAAENGDWVIQCDCGHREYIDFTGREEKSWWKRAVTYLKDLTQVKGKRS